MVSNLIRLFDTGTFKIAASSKEIQALVRFFEPWGGYRRGQLQMIATFGEDWAAEMVDNKIAEYIAEERPEHTKNRILPKVTTRKVSCAWPL